MELLAGGTDSDYPRRVAGPVVEKLCRGTESRCTAGPSSALVLVGSLRPPRKLATANSQGLSNARRIYPVRLHQPWLVIPG